MAHPILLVSDPPHGEVDVEKAADLLGLDVFATRLKAKFVAPEVLAARDPVASAQLLADLRSAGLSVSALKGADLVGIPWPDPASALAFDEACLRATVRNRTVELSYETELVSVYAEPPGDMRPAATVDLDQAILSGLGPMIAEALQWKSNVDLYYHVDGALRRMSLVPDVLNIDGDALVRQIERRFRSLRLDTRLVGVRPRARYAAGTAGHEARRKGFSFGTRQLAEVLGSLSAELGAVSQFELGSRLSVALGGRA